MQHAWLIYGPEGPERRQAARRQAAMLAGGLRAEALAAEGHHPDIDEYLDPLRIEPVREITAAAGRPPVLGSRRVVLLGDLTTATREAQNALLRLVEEPPDTLAFVGEATSPGALLPTLRSRFLSQTVAHRGVDELVEVLANESGAAPRWVLDAAAGSAQGSLDRARGLCAVILGLKDALPLDDARADWFVRAAEAVEGLPKNWPTGLGAVFALLWHTFGEERHLASWRAAEMAERQLQTTASARLVAEVLLQKVQRLESLRAWPNGNGGEG